MDYQIQPGIELVRICGVSLLVPDRDAMEHCSYIMRLSGFQTATWEMLTRGKSLDEIIRVHRILSGKEEEELRNQVGAFLDDLEKKDFLINERKETIAP